MHNLNSLIIEGIAGSEPVITVSEKGTSICTFMLVSKRISKDSDNIQEESVEITVEAWAQLAELCSRRCKKGRGLRVVGRLKQNIADGKIEVIAEHIEFKSVATDMRE